MSKLTPCAELKAYLESDGALTIAELRERVGAKKDDQIRHWRDGVRRPKPITAVAIERATSGAVARNVWYPNEWQEIWPELRQPSTPTKEVGND